MSCPLIGQIAVITDPGMADEDLDAIRVWHRNHDVLLIKPTIHIWSAIEDIIELIDPEDRPRLVYGVECSCEALLRTA